MYTGELQRQLVCGLLSDFFLQDEDRCFMAGTITLFTFSTTTSLSYIYTQQRILVRRGRVFIPPFFKSPVSFLICLLFITSSPLPEINSDQSSVVFFSAPRRSKIWGFLDEGKRVSICYGDLFIQ